MVAEYGAEHFARDVDVSRETLKRLEAYVALLAKWQQKTNLISESTLGDVWRRHVFDSAQLATLVPNWRHGRWVDLGSGAGFPGMVLAIMRPSGAPPVHMVESNRRKSIFLKEAARITETQVAVLNKRIETVDPFQADIISSRACARLETLLGWSQNFMGKNSVCVFHKGQDVEEELTEAHKYWNMQTQIAPSQSHPGGKILLIGDIQRV